MVRSRGGARVAGCNITGGRPVIPAGLATERKRGGLSRPGPGIETHVGGGDDGQGGENGTVGENRAVSLLAPVSMCCNYIIVDR